MIASFRNWQQLISITACTPRIHPTPLLEVIGTVISDRVKEKFAEFGFDQFEPTSQGFRGEFLRVAQIVPPPAGLRSLL